MQYRIAVLAVLLAPLVLGAQTSPPRDTTTIYVPQKVVRDTVKVPDTTKVVVYDTVKVNVPATRSGSTPSRPRISADSAAKLRALAASRTVCTGGRCVDTTTARLEAERRSSELALDVRKGREETPPPARNTVVRVTTLECQYPDGRLERYTDRTTCPPYVTNVVSVGASKESWWQGNRGWVIPVAIGTAIGVAIARENLIDLSSESSSSSGFRPKGVVLGMSRSF